MSKQKKIKNPINVVGIYYETNIRTVKGDFYFFLFSKKANRSASRFGYVDKVKIDLGSFRILLKGKAT